jgi:hypothetical protein
MNITPLTIYFWQLADKIEPWLIAATIVSLITSIILLVIHGFATAEAAKLKAKKSPDGYYDDDIALNEAAILWTSKWRRTLPASILAAGLAALLPSSNTIAMMVIIPKIAESKVLQQDLPDIYNAAVQALKDQLQKK